MPPAISRALVVCVALLLPLSWAPLRAIYIQPILEATPIARLIANLTRQVQQAPSDGQAHWALARAHAMAASDPARIVQVTKDGGRVWLGHEPRYVPFEPVPATSAATGRETRTHLELAITHHRRALALMPGNGAVRLGLAWCLQQAGRTDDAIGEYRAAIAAAWPDEGRTSVVGLGGHTIVAEAAGYLMPLLDPVRDAREIATLRTRVAELGRLPVPITPIVVDLDDTRDARALLDERARVSFDLDGRGRARSWDWVTPRAAWLVWDPRQTGRITSGTQLFGAVTFLMAWTTGYDALAALDDDDDGWLTGPELQGVALWRDADGNATSDAGEVRPVQQHGIVAIATRGLPGDGGRVAARAPVGVRLADGSTRPTVDLVLHPAAIDITSAVTPR